MAATEQPRPNRDAYKKAFAEDYPDMDFEDKEARYGKMLDDRNQLRKYRDSGNQLNGILDKNRWLAVVLQELANNPETNPIEVMAQSGIDINEVMKDEETRQKVSDKLAAYQQKQLDDEGEQNQGQAVAAGELVQKVQYITEWDANNVAEAKSENHNIPPDSGNGIIVIPMVEGITA